MKLKPRMQFEPAYYETEMRDGFLVMGLMKRAWAAQMEVLAVIDGICKKHGLKWFADSGTLLGAIRHKGFIPWDDDIDIAMLREDYNKLVRLLPAELPEGFVYFGPMASNAANDVSYSFFMRIVNTGQIRFDGEFLDRFHGFPYAAGIDIFPLDGVPNDEEEHTLLCSIVKLILSTDGMLKTMNDVQLEQALQAIEDACAVPIRRDGDIHSQLMRLTDALFAAYTVSECDELCCIGWHAMDIEGVMRKEWYADTVLLPFEMISIPVPVAYHEVARAIFGESYMTPMQVTGYHNYPFWKEQKEEAYRRLRRTGYEDREAYVARTMGVDVAEVLELSKMQDDSASRQYQYFCQGKPILIDVPLDFETGFSGY